MNKVFIPHIAERYSAASLHKVPVFDFSAAARFGSIVSVLDRDDDPLFFARNLPKIKKALEDFAADDYLIAVGDPSIIAVCAGIIARRHDSFKLLKWDKQTTSYIELEITP